MADYHEGQVVEVTGKSGYMSPGQPMKNNFPTWFKAKIIRRLNHGIAPAYYKVVFIDGFKANIPEDHIRLCAKV